MSLATLRLFKGKKLFPLVVSLGSLFALVAPTQSWAKAVRFGAPDYWCPYTCKAGSKQEGFVTEVVKAAFKNSGLEVNYSNAVFQRAVKNFQTGKADMMPMPQSAANKPGLMQASRPHAVIELCTFVSEKTKKVPKSVTDFKNIKPAIAMSQGLQHAALTELSAAQKKPLKLVSGDGAVVRVGKMIKASRASGVIEDLSLLTYLMKKDAFPKTKRAFCFDKKDPYVMVFAEANPRGKDLQKAFSEGLEKVVRSGQYKTIMAGYGLEPQF